MQSRVYACMKRVDDVIDLKVYIKGYFKSVCMTSDPIAQPSSTVHELLTALMCVM